MRPAIVLGLILLGWPGGSVDAATLEGRVEENAPQSGDVFATDCQAQNARTNPYAGMDPLRCRGVMMPADSRGACTGQRGWTLLRQEGSTCYFCEPLQPPINGIIVPLERVNDARLAGYRCGVNQADRCSAVCQGELAWRPPDQGTGSPGVAPRPAEAPDAQPVGSAWACDACTPQLCFRLSAELTVCRAADAGNQGDRVASPRDPPPCGTAGADARLQWLECFTFGWRRCLEEQLAGDILNLPVTFLAGRYKKVGHMLMYLGNASAIETLIGMAGGSAALDEFLSKALSAGTMQEQATRAGYVACGSMQFRDAFRLSRSSLQNEGEIPESIRGRTKEASRNPAPLPQRNYDPRHARAHVGERLAADALAANGHEILYMPTRVKETLARGIDLITMKDGIVYFIDNKAYRLADKEILYDVTALRKNYDYNLDRAIVMFGEELAGPFAKQYMEALTAVTRGRVIKAVTNANALFEPERKLLKDVSAQLASEGIQMIDLRKLESSPVCRSPPVHVKVAVPCERLFNMTLDALDKLP